MKKALFDYWDKVNDTMINICEAARIMLTNQEVADYLKEHSGYSEEEDAVYFVCDYVKRMLQASFDE